jgi:methionine-rich copper-binding protein CopC
MQPTDPSQRSKGSRTMKLASRSAWPAGARRARPLLALAALLLAAAPAAGSGSAFHLHLLRSDPAADTTLHAAPSALRLTFSEAPELGVTSVRLRHTGGASVSLARLARAPGDRNTVVSALRGRLTPGNYAVTWRTMSRDGHPMHGTFHFELAAHAH